jgi:Na+-transporting NADH:ubiquinone oxidoreductase subunit NqrB
VSSVTHSTASVSWTKPNSNGRPVTGYAVNVTGLWSVFGSVSSNITDVSSTELALSGLLAQFTYEVSVRPENSIGKGEWSVTVSFKMNGTWPLPQGLGPVSQLPCVLTLASILCLHPFPCRLSVGFLLADVQNVSRL